VTDRYSYGKRLRWELAHGVTRTVDARPVQAHVAALLVASWSARSIAACAGYPPSVIQRITRHRRVYRSTAARVLAVTPARLFAYAPSTGWVPAVGTRRRIQGLLALGHSHQVITKAMGDPPTSSNLTLARTRHDGALVNRATHDAAACAYELLSMRPGASQVCRDRAARSGYVPPLAWDDEDLDNPTATPSSTPLEPAPTDGRGWRQDVVLEDATWLLEQGLTLAETATRLGLHPDSVLRAFTRAGIPVPRHSSRLETAS